MSEPLIQEFKFPYEIEYWKRRARKTRDALVSGEGILSLQQATPAEAPVAFLISIRATHGKFGPIEVRSFQDDLWWPVVHHRQLVTSSELRGRFAVGDIYFLSLLDPRFGWRMERVQKEDDLDVRQIERSTRDEMLAVAQSGSSQLLLCDDIVFMKGGEPVHICDLSWRSDRRRYRSTVMVVDPKRILCGGVRSPSSFGSCTRSEFDRCASQGAIFRADEIEKAKAFYAGHDATVFRVSSVKTVNVENIYTDPLDHQMAATVRVIAERFPAKAASPGEAIAELKALADMGDIPFMTGITALQNFITQFEQEQLSETLKYPYRLAAETIERIRIEYAQRGGALPVFDEEIDAALAGLVT